MSLFWGVDTYVFGPEALACAVERVVVPQRQVAVAQLGRLTDVLLDDPAQAGRKTLVLPSMWERAGTVGLEEIASGD